MRGEATKAGIDALMTETTSVLVDYDKLEQTFIQAYREDDGKVVHGVVLVCLKQDGTEAGRMIAQIRAVTTAEEYRAGTRQTLKTP